MSQQRKTEDVRSTSRTGVLDPRDPRKGAEARSSPPPPALLGPTESSSGERSETEEDGVGPNRATRPPVPPDPEVAAKPERRTFTAKYKLQILEEADLAEPGEVGQILRREGLYSSHLTAWRQARRTGALRHLGRKRGRKAETTNPLAKKVVHLERELTRTREQLRKAELIIEVQGKVAGLLGFCLEEGRSS